MCAALRPMPGPNPAPAGSYDLARLGYAEQEFLLEGTAESYRLAGDRTADGRWAAEPGDTAPFTTRILVRRPERAFSGTVVVEWLNVSGGLDAAPVWMMAHTHLIRRGHAWVGVSAQRAGLEGGGLVEGMHLKAAFPDRYTALSHPGDAWSFDMFSQAGRALLADAGTGAPLGPHAPARLLAVGQSQSAAFLVSYINAVDQRARVYDGFSVHGRPAASAQFDRGFMARTRGGRGPRPAEGDAERIRDDLRVPVIVLQTETDLTLLGSGRVAQPDGELLRNWDLAGAAHGDTYLLMASGHDDGRLPAERLARLMQPTTKIVMGDTDVPINSGPQHHYVACAALDHLDRWAAGGAPAPAPPRLRVTADGLDVSRDDRGVAVGGIRTPWTDVPTAVLSGVGQTGGNVFGFLFGTTTPLAADLSALYPGGLTDYLARFGAALDASIAAGCLLADDREEILAVAEAAGRACL